jgi:3-deoxy-7-phosphoheptulonate synthase
MTMKRDLAQALPDVEPLPREVVTESSGHGEPQAVRYRDELAAARCHAELSRRPPILSAAAIGRLTTEIARAQRGESFLLQAGDCAESFASAEMTSVKQRLRLLWQLGALLERVMGVPAIRLGRIAGQYAKPRSTPYEVVAGQSLLAFRGENVNGVESTPEAREPRPERLLLGHDAASRTVQLLDEIFARPGKTIAAASGPITALAERHADFRAIRGELRRAPGPATDAHVGRDLFTSHEALLLPYERTLTRRDEGTGLTCNLGAHSLWLGDRTRQPDGAHVAYLRTIANPIGVKLGPAATVEEIRELVQLLNPAAQPGRLTLIARLGISNVRRLLPGWLDGLRTLRIPVLWSCDPMHGNTYKTASGVKSRRLVDIAAEIAATIEIHREMGSRLGGLHLEVAGSEVTECVGGLVDVREADLSRRYESLCDPRLSVAQSLELVWGLRVHAACFAQWFRGE